MPRRPRIQFPGAYYHVYNRGVEKRSLFLDDRDRKTFLKLIADTVHRHRLRLFTYCLMDNHYHLFLQTLEANLGGALQSLQSQYAHYFNFRHERVGALFGTRYKSNLVDTDSYAFDLVRYIHRNPLEAGMIQKLEDYPWSSYASYIGNFPVGDWLDIDWLMNQLHSDPDKAIELFKFFH